MSNELSIHPELRAFARTRAEHDLDRDVETILDDLAAQARSLVAGGYATDPVRTFVEQLVADGETAETVAAQFEQYASSVRELYDHMDQAAFNLRQAEAEGTMIPMDDSYFDDLRERIAAREQEATEA